MACPQTWSPSLHRAAHEREAGRAAAAPMVIARAAGRESRGGGRHAGVEGGCGTRGRGAKALGGGCCALWRGWAAQHAWPASSLCTPHISGGLLQETLVVGGASAQRPQAGSGNRGPAWGRPPRSQVLPPIFGWHKRMLALRQGSVRVAANFAEGLCARSLCCLCRARHFGFTSTLRSAPQHTVHYHMTELRQTCNPH